MQPGPSAPPTPPAYPGYAPPPPPPPGYAPPSGYPYYAPAPPQKGTSPALIIAVVVIVLALAFMVPVMYVMMTGLTTPPGPVRATVSLSAGAWSGNSLVVTITSVSTSTLQTRDLAFQIVANNGTHYFTGAAGEGNPVNGVVTSVTYNDATGDGRVGADDNIVISVDSPAGLDQLHGTRFRILDGTDVLGTVALP